MSNRVMGAGLPRQKPSPLARVLVSASDVFGAADRAAHPFRDLILRLWLAQIFFRAAIVNLADWKGTLYLFAHEPPVSWMDPVTVAYLGTGIELIAPFLLALGLATRPAALALLAVTLAMQGTYEQLNAHVFWALLFAWYALMGAGSLSVDRLLSRGSEDIAPPLRSVPRSAVRGDHPLSRTRLPARGASRARADARRHHLGGRHPLDWRSSPSVLPVLARLASLTV